MLKYQTMNHIDYYVKKINSALQGGGNIKISTFLDEHYRLKPLLEPNLNKANPDISALVYDILRLPPQIFSIKQIIMGQSDKVFLNAGIDVNNNYWEFTSTVARRRKFKINAKQKQLATFIASPSDVYDVVTILTALYIEINKLYELTVKQHKNIKHCFNSADFAKLTEVLGARLNEFLAIIKNPTNFELRLLASSYVDYAQAVQAWWINIAGVRKYFGYNLYDQPIYFVSSNSHSLINIISGFPYKNSKLLHKDNKTRLQINKKEFLQEQVSKQNICYYLSRFTEKRNLKYKQQKNKFELQNGLVTLPPYHHIDIEAQIFSIKDFINNPYLDSRLKISAKQKKFLAKSNALILNVAYPLGLSAYHILKEVSENANYMRGVYIMGKAASLNALVGDITIPNFVFNRYTNNQIYVKNNLSTNSIKPFFGKRSIFSNQKAITVHGTFLQNEQSLRDDYNKGYSIVEMEAGPYLERLFEMQNPERHPYNDTYVLDPNFRLGLAYYVSDTPHNKGINLGAKRLTWEGLNATYAISLGILSDILTTEYNQLKK